MVSTTNSKFIALALVLFASIFTVFGATFYQMFDFSYSGTAPTSVFVTGNTCQDNGCTSVTDSAKIYSEEAYSTCWVQFGANGDGTTFNSCIAQYEKTNGIVTGTRVVVAHTIPFTHKLIDYFSTSQDSYLVNAYRTDRVNGCETDICFDTTAKAINFIKKENAIAEVGQLKIRNTNNDKLPVQIDVPVSIDNTVCSAFRFTIPGMYLPQVPAGYSDYSAQTQISLAISNAKTGEVYKTDSQTTTILADYCHKNLSFAWTPNVPVNTSVTFKVETSVTDNQVVQPSFTDSTSATETIYPIDLATACWVKIQDFTLANVPNQNLNTSIAQYTQGETLYSLFDAVAYQGNAMNPIQFTAQMFVDNVALGAPATYLGASEWQSYVNELTQQAIALSLGAHTVKLVLNPVPTAQCSFYASAEQTQNLQVLAPEKYTATFVVRDSQDNLVNQANINLQLLTADDYYAYAPVYNKNQQTDSNGNTVFTDVIAGEYKYTITKTGYTAVTQNVRIASNSIFYIELPAGNVAPIVDVPENATIYYKNEYQLSLPLYVSDFNDGFNGLSLSTQVTSEVAVASIIDGVLHVSSQIPQDVVVQISAQDPAQAHAEDSITIHFIDNAVPVIDTFTATPTTVANLVPVTFTIAVHDVDSTQLTCTLAYGDGLSVTQSCSQMSSNLTTLTHAYATAGTQIARLTVTDGYTTVFAQQYIQVVYQRPGPQIMYFNYSSSNDEFVPTNLTLTWNVVEIGSVGTLDTCFINYIAPGSLTAEKTVVSCTNGVMHLDNYNLTGVSKFVLYANDSAKNSDMREISISLFEKKDVRLTPANTQLVVAPRITLGEFTFTVRTTNESLAKRLVSVKPIIACRGLDNTLVGNEILATLAVSKKDDDGNNTFTFKANTDDFNFVVPENEACTLSVVLDDVVDSNLKLSKTIVFGLPISEEKVQSIRGKGTDIANYMTKSIEGLSYGYNTISFEISNNEQNDKSISLTVTSTELPINSKTDLTLGPGKTKKVTIPVFVDEDTAKGSYKVRISVSDGQDKQTRYTTVFLK